jgi:hypothetical protein
MANVPLKNGSAVPYLNAIKEAADAVSEWPSWKRDTTVFTKPENQEEIKVAEPAE